LNSGALAVIPARGGSKRLPRKNAMPFLGRPMMAYTIQAALESGVCGRVVVSTDDAEMAAIAQQAGAEVSLRPADLASDQARVSAVCLWELDREAAEGRVWDRLICLYPTAPMRSAEDIRATAALLDQGADFALAVTTYDLPPHQALRLDASGGASPMWPELVNKRDSEIGQLVVDNGSTYAVKTEAFRRVGGFYGQPLRVHVMSRDHSVDINTIDDFRLAEYLAVHGGGGRA
jgi:CMP-N-acetylneuraminic acid synthetase